MAQPPEKPSLNDEHRLLDFCFIPRTSRPRWQNGSVIMRRHLGVGSIDLRVVETSLDNSGLGIVRHQQMRNAAEHLESSTWASIQSGSACVQLACAKVKLDAPSTATKICALRISPVSRSMTTGTPSPA